jgi:hypothetical protein
MSNSLFPTAKESFLKGEIDLATDNIKVVLLSATYTYSAAHQFLSSLSGTVATSGNLASKTTTSGVFDAADVTFTAVTGSAVTQIVIYQDTGVAGTSRLIAFFDTGVTGLPVTPNGGDISITWSGSGIFAL